MACHDSVYRYARGLSNDPVVAEELVQETYRKALAARRKPEPLNLESVRPWLFTILRNHWHNRLRDRSRDTELDPAGDIPTAETPESIVLRRFLQSEVRHALDALPTPYREVIVLRELESLSYSEIATILNCPVGTVMSRLARARGLMRSLLTKLVPAQGKAVGS